MVILLLITLFNIVFLDFIEIKQITPDFCIILVVWITLKDGRFTGLIAGFLIGLYLDIISADVIGTNAFAKTLCAFAASYFYKESATKQITKKYSFILITLFAALVHNLIYCFYYIRTSEHDFILYYVRYSLASTLYTTFFSSFVLLFQITRNRIKY